MYISTLKVQNFKSFKDVVIHFNKDINVFTGVNNSGKTTCLEAIALWNECFSKLLRQAGRANPKLGLDKEDFMFGTSQPLYVPFNDINSVRSPDFNDIFHNLNRKNTTILLEAIIKKDQTEVKIGFAIRAADGGQNYQISLVDRDGFDYKTFNKLFKRLPESISVMYASPIAAVRGVENFVTIPVIKNLLNARESVTVLRNRIYQLKKQAHLFLDFQQDLSYILTNNLEPVDVQIIGDEASDINVYVNIKIGAKDTPKNVSLLGSGTLQIIEVLLALYESKKELNLILLDEPDSHIHRSIQQRLIVIMQRFVENTQVFVTTHNEGLIRAFEPKFVFHFEQNTSKEYYNIVHNSIQKVKKGLQPSRTNHIIASLSDGNNSLDFINALECDKLILVEGDDDARNLSILLQQRTNDKNKYMFWSFEGIAGIFNNIKYYKEIFSLIKNQRSLWDKAVLIFDKDELTDSQREKLEDAFNTKLGIKAHIWESYTFETTLLANQSHFIRLIEKYLTSLGIPINTEKITQIVEKHLHEYGKTKLEQWSNTEGGSESYQSQYFHRVKNEKRTKLSVLFGGHARNIITDNDGALQPEFGAYIKNVCNNTSIHKLAKKDLIQRIMEEILEPHGNKFDIENDFVYLLLCVDKSIWQDDWDFLLTL